ncbi:MAG: type VI secretion system tip protein VgrG [Sandaracinaceae bacterium]|nr:type VI secretion system tip protein VgrG [Sandaracinaceae bacterium]
MSATTIDLRLSRALIARAFDESRAHDLTLSAADEAQTGSNALPTQPWRVARMHLVERLGEPYRCELLIARIEALRNDPATAAVPNTAFNDISNALDDGTRDASGRENDLQSVDDNLDSAFAGPWRGIPGAVGNAIGSAVGIVTGTANQVANGLMAPQGIEQYLLGIPPATPWVPDLAPKPGVFLDKLYSVLVTRVGPGNTPLTGRWVTGLVTEFEDLGLTSNGRRLVRLVIEPQLARLSLRTNHRVFEQMTAMQIVKKIFDEALIYTADFVPPGLGNKRAYCIQYGETDLDFVLRLISEEGLVPVFDHHLGAERLQLLVPSELQARYVRGYGTDGSVETLDSADMPRATLDELVHGAAVDAALEEVLWDFNVTRAVAPTAVSVRGTDFSTSATGADEPPTHVRPGDAEAPDAEAAIDLAFADRTQSSWHQFPARTAFEFDPETAVQTDAVDPNAEARLELIAARALARLGRGRTNAVGLAAGQSVDVTHGRPLIDPAIFDDEVAPLGRFVITRLEVLAENDAAPVNAQLPPAPSAFLRPARPLGLEALVEAIPESVLFLPPRRRAPRIDGVQTAITRAGVGEWKEGYGRIGVDPIGRVKATLPWDRGDAERPDPPLSPPIRVTTPWAGHAWGTTFLPREGMELLVAYLDGDPLQPIALGALHGFVNPAPRERPHIDFVTGENRIDPVEEKVVGDDEARLHYDPEKQKRPTGDRHLNAIRTAIHPTPKEDAYKAFHELSFDDTPGRERVRLHSAGVLDEHAEHDQRTWVGRDQMNIVQGEQTELVKGNQTLVVDGDRNKVVTGHEDREVLGRQDVTVKGMKTLTVHGDHTRHVGIKEKAEDVHRIGLKEGDGVLRLLESRRDRKTKIQGDDTRTVGGDVDVRCGETYELGGAPLVMTATAQGGEGGPGLSNDNEFGETALDGATGECELVADGKITVRAETIDLNGATSIRFECGEVNMELTADELVMNAPNGVAFWIAGRGAAAEAGELPASSCSLVVETRTSPDITFKLSDNAASDGGQYVGVLRPSPRTDEYLDAEDALEGGPGVKIAPIDSFVIQGGLSAFQCRRVEYQRKGGPKHVHREMTDAEKKLLEDIAQLKKDIEKLEKEADEAVKKRNVARAEYVQAAKERKDIESRIKEDDGIDEELAAAIDRVTAAEKALQKANRDEQRAYDAVIHAIATGQSHDDEDDAHEEAKDKVEDAKSELEDAEEQLEETREEHGGLMDEYVAARDKEEEKGQKLLDAQEEVARTQNRLARAERELAKKEHEASDLELYDEEQEAAQ